MEEQVHDPEEVKNEQTHAEEPAQEEEFNWFDDTAEFGFDDTEEFPKTTDIAHVISKGMIPALIALIGISFLGMFILNFIPGRMRIIHGFALKHIFILLAITSFLLILSKIIVHGVYIAIRDYITDNNILHNRKLKLEVIFGIWFFTMIPIGIHLDRYIPWARVILDRIFICGFLTILAFICKGLVMELFREQFLSNSLKDKAKDIEIKNRIINTLREYCYDAEEEESDPKLANCFFVNFLEGEDNPNDNQGMDFIKGDVDSVVGDMFTKSIFTKSQLTQHEVLCLARDVFTKCSKNKKYINFNDFCEMFPNAQTAIQAFLYFDVSNSKKLTKKEIRDTLGMFYYNRKNLQTSFESLNNFVGVLDNLAIILVIIPLIIMYFIVLGIPIQQLVAFSLSSALILNFFISTIAKDFCLNVSFILTHPFDIGDDIIIDGKSYVIYRTSLYKTEVLGIDGGKISFLNKVLWNKNIINMTRAPQKLIHISFKLDQNMSKHYFKLIKKNILSYLRSKNEIFYETFTIQSESEAVCKIEEQSCVLIIRCKSIGSKMAKLELKIEIINYLKDLLKKLEKSQTKKTLEKKEAKETEEKEKKEEKK
ncbi:hypothetical protein NEMIN01_0587 [Nematocida minor]|uniref:uncharacterized protein n=1 Tax=Nematocida minor TaxID=1912983 RepID=UPI00221F7843|nr:uncharacterized protein NEMIN01_0587 [Nematocida minor]KAI5189634.1 hypothetical protein NEMIN01_0587 [Nematocida minor]